LAVLLSDQPAMPPSLRYYQRTLAKDRAEAQEIVEFYARSYGIARAFDEVLMPALRQARRDRRREELTADEEAYVYELSRQVIEQLAAARHAEQEAPTEDTNGHRARAGEAEEADGDLAGMLVLGCPAHHESEELPLEMLRQLLEPSECRVKVVSTKVLPSEVTAQAEQQRPAVIFIATLPPGGLAQARYLAEQFRKQSENRPIVVGYWGNHRNFDGILVRLRASGASYVTTSLAQTRSQIVSLLKRVASLGEVQAVSRVHELQS
jgi:hypothetical protein